MLDTLAFHQALVILLWKKEFIIIYYKKTLPELTKSRKRFASHTIELNRVLAE